MCTVMGKRDNNYYWLGSNSDNPWDTRTKICVNNKGKFKYIGTKLKCPNDDLPWSNMMTRGVNEAGIAFTFAYVERDLQIPLKEGIGFKEFGATILGQFSSLNDIEKFLKNEQININGNFIFADDQGILLCCEFLPYEARFIWSQDLTIFRTNHFLEMPTPNNQEIHPSSTNRFQSMLTALRKLKPVNDMKTSIHFLLQNHELDEENQQWGNSNCSHGVSGGTISSEIIDPKSRTIWYCYGAPCGSQNNLQSWGEYKPFTLSDYDSGDITSYDGKIIQQGPSDAAIKREPSE